jgi:hypothetical protein
MIMPWQVAVIVLIAIVAGFLLCKAFEELKG